jgi:glycosyltransferase involved in cell wall biosynthesis
VTLENLPAEPYLVGGRRPVQKLIEDGPELTIGLVWGGRTPNANLARRSLDLDALGPLLVTPGARFYSLQKGEPAEALAAHAYRDRIVDLGPALNDFFDTAAAIERLDLVITIDTAVAHLAGAMGKPVWVLLMEVPDWRWMLDRTDSPWYPSARLFRQTSDGGWDAVVRRVADALGQAVGDQSFTRATPPSEDERVASDARLFLEDELRPGDGLIHVGAADPIGTPGATEIVAPDLASLDLTTITQRVAACRRVFLRVDAPDEVPGAIAACGELLATSRLAAVLWPDLASGDSDLDQAGAARRHQIVRGTLGSFGFQHFRVDQEDEGPVLNPWTAAHPAQTVVSLAKGMLPGEVVGAEHAEPEISGPARAPVPLGFDWQLGASSGWGAYGLNLALHAPSFGVLPRPLNAPDLRAVSPLQAYALAPMLGSHAEPPRRNLRALGNGLRGATIEGTRPLEDVGVVFFEDTALDAAALARGRRFQRIVAGSTWNAEVLRGYGLEDVVVAIQGIDPTVFHPAPSTGLFADRFVVFSGGKLEYRKGQDLVVAAFREFHRRHPDSVLMVAWHNHWPRTMAEIPLRGHVTGAPAVDAQGRMNTRGWLAANGIPESAVIDLGLVPNGMMGQILREAHVGLFPNRCEGGTNLVAMECMASGLPTILSANSGHLDLISDERCYPLRRQHPALPSSQFRGVDGWGESDVEEMIETLEDVYQRRADAAARGEEAARFMTGFSWRNQIGALLDSIADLL